MRRIMIRSQKFWRKKMQETIEQIRERVKKSHIKYNENITCIERILMDERGYVSRKPRGENIVVLCSGGLDSSVMLDKIIREWDVKVFPMFLKRGARAEKHEEAAFDYFMDFYSKRFLDNIKEPFKFSFEIPPKEMKKYFPANLVLTQGHPLRNSTMQNLAVMYAVSLNGKYSLDIKTVLSGSVGEDYREPELGILSLRSQTLNTCIQTGDWKWQITSPLTDPYLTDKTTHKTDLIEYAIERFIPLDKTRTCFSKEKTADGTCFACLKRLQAFEKLGLEDPVTYKRQRKLSEVEV
jgi:7-cyano-7-deazaguanine synthase in queuosine biosynthesis